MNNVDDYILRSYQRLTAKEQAKRLKLSYSAITQRRVKLARQGLLDYTKRRWQAEWTAADTDKARRMIMNGEPIEAVAAALGRPKWATYFHLEQHLGGIDELRRGKVWSLQQIQQLLATTWFCVHLWVEQGYLPAKRASHKQAEYHVTTDDLLRFLHCQQAWMDYSPKLIRDPVWRKAAEQARADIDGQWLTVRDLMQRYDRGYSTITNWIRNGHIPVLRRGSERIFIWSADLEGLALPPPRKKSVS